MHGENGQEISVGMLLRRMAVLLTLSISVAVGAAYIGLEMHQCVAVGVFLAIILGTLFFWTFRLAIAFIGVAVLIFTKSLNIPQFVESSALPVILFLAGMMIIVGALRDLGFFTWVVQVIVSMPRITGIKFIVAVSVTSALLACAVD
ncbi:MAG TPA: hypothetical protein PKL84_11840, partial [Candidatus Hydrogenedentes bacterium]|nr:hypothetical protein [Candidatus Hydrogenedentota bacterium]